MQKLTNFIITLNQEIIFKKISAILRIFCHFGRINAVLRLLVVEIGRCPSRRWLKQITLEVIKNGKRKNKESS
ncbi:MAG: hypothetical protein Q8N86_05370 [Atribacterota bacterium]|nr:hypothetical protein [Atribacterota bacterium]